jgi:glycosyltransferase involved in cell wall biosynthesis
MMKVLVIGSVAFSFRTLLIHQIDYFISHNLKVDIVCSPDSDAEYLREAGYTVHTMPIARKIDPASNLQSIIDLYQLMQRENYDLVHVHAPVSALLGRVAAKLAGVKRVVYTAHGFRFNDKMSVASYQFYFWIEKIAATVTSKILTQSWEDYQTAKVSKLIAAEQLGYLGNGIDIHKFDRARLAPDTRAEIRQEFKIPSDRLVIGIVARITKIKGQGDLLNAFIKLQSQFEHLHLLIVGGRLDSETDSYQEEIEREIDRHQLHDRVTITGIRTDIPELLTAMDILSLPSYWEGLPRSTIEAMAMELPIVTTDIRGCREAVVDNETGIIVPPGDVDRLASALARLVADPELRQRFGSAGRKRAEIEYDERNVFKRLAQTYTDLGMAMSDPDRLDK